MPCSGQRQPPTPKHTLPTPPSAPNAPFSSKLSGDLRSPSLLSSLPLLDKGQMSTSKSTPETWLQHEQTAGILQTSTLYLPSRPLRVQLPLSGTPATSSLPGESDLSFQPLLEPHLPPHALSQMNPSSCARFLRLTHAFTMAHVILYFNYLFCTTLAHQQSPEA